MRLPDHSVGSNLNLLNRLSASLRFGGGFRGGMALHDGGFRGGGRGFGHDRDFGRRFGFFGGYYPYDYYNDYSYDGSYYDNGSCYVVQRRMHTAHGWRLQPVQVCS